MRTPVVLIEFEGVLADTSEARRVALERGLYAEGIVLEGRAWADASAHRSVAAAVRAACSTAGARLDATALELAERRTEDAFAAIAGKGLALRPGAAEFLTAAATQGRVAIVTRAQRGTVEFVLGLGGLEYAVESIVAAGDAQPEKPDPAPYHTALRRLARKHAVDLRRTVALEDGPPGIAAARGAGLRVIAVGALPAHLALEADAVIESLVDESPATLFALLDRGRPDHSSGSEEPAEGDER